MKTSAHLLLFCCRLTVAVCLSLLPVGSEAQQKKPSVSAKKMEAYGLVDVCTLDPTIIVELMYASADNFMGQAVYGDLRQAYLHPRFAERLAEANRLLQKEYNAHYRLIIYDAARPQSIQYKMYEVVRGTPGAVYVAHPRRGGRHNYGVAVDLSIWDVSRGCALDMGTPPDYFGVEAHVDNEEVLVKQGRLSEAAHANRQMLRRLMRRVGLVPYRREWWHYEEPIPMPEVRQRYRLLDF